VLLVSLSLLQVVVDLGPEILRSGELPGFGLRRTIAAAIQLVPDDDSSPRFFRLMSSIRAPFGMIVANFTPTPKSFVALEVSVAPASSGLSQYSVSLW
jgi:hypothetical protein